MKNAIDTAPTPRVAKFTKHYLQGMLHAARHANGYVLTAEEAVFAKCYECFGKYFWETKLKNKKNKQMCPDTDCPLFNLMFCPNYKGDE